VQEGDVLLQLDTSDLYLQLKQAYNNLAISVPIFKDQPPLFISLR
jgi:multidrug resistance efflux pump